MIIANSTVYNVVKKCSVINLTFKMLFGRLHNVSCKTSPWLFPSGVNTYWQQPD